MSPKRLRSRVEPTDEWEQLELLCAWPEQVRYELIRPLVLFGVSAAERSRQTTGAVSERTLYRRTERFEEEGMESLFSSEGAKRRALPRWVRRMIAELKGEHPALNPNEISNIVYVRMGRKPDRKTVKKVLSEEPIPLRMVRRFEPYHDIPEARERRLAVVGLHAEGWTVKAIAGYLKINRDTVYRTLKKWIEEDVEGLEDKPRGRPPGVRKVTLRTIETVRRLQENPGLGAFRVRAALKQLGIHISSATCGRILARNRKIYGLEKPKGGRRSQCLSPRRCATNTGAWTCATWTWSTRTSSAAGPTRSRS